MSYTLDQFVKFSAFILTSSDGHIDEEEKKVLFNHPMIKGKSDIDIDPLLDLFENEIKDKKGGFFDQFKYLFDEVDDNFKFEFITLLDDIMHADGVIDDNEFFIYDSISKILNFDKNKYLEEVFNDKKLKEIKIPPTYSVLKLDSKKIRQTLSKSFKISSRISKRNKKILIDEVDKEFKFEKWDNGQLEGSSHDITIKIDHRKFKDSKFGTYFIVLTAVNSNGGYYGLDKLKLKFGDSKQNLTLVKTSGHSKHNQTSRIGSGDLKVDVTIYAESIQFTISPFEFKKIIELNNSLEFIAVTHRSKIVMSTDLKNSLISLFNYTTDSNFKSFEMYKSTNEFKSKIKKHNDNLLIKSFKKIQNDIENLGLEKLDLNKVEKSFLDNKIWGILKKNENIDDLFEGFVGNKYWIIAGILALTTGFIYDYISGWWIFLGWVVIGITIVYLYNNENSKKFNIYVTDNKSKYDMFLKLINDNKPKLLR